MKKAFAVIGSNYGDEGKGGVVDALASHLDNVLVIRHNSGAQCSHTVSVKGMRHSFGHIGAGSMAGAPTYLSSDFVVHPFLFMLELDELDKKGITPKVIVDPQCKVTTPFDVLLNRWAEEDRGENRHGSCGIGFGETIEIGNYFDNTFMNMAHIIESHDLDKWLPLVYPYYRKRMEQLKINPLPERLEYLKTGKCPNAYGSIDAWIHHYELMLNYVEIAPAVETLRDKYDNFIFEGGQGLLLDQNNILDFPYLTRSNTGIRNVLYVSREMGIDKIQPIYVTRPYLTRHGAGPLPNETTNLEGFNIVDKTNIYSRWQGNLRFAPMDWNKFNFRVVSDYMTGKPRVENPSIAITCVDQAIRFDIPLLKLPVSMVRHGVDREDTELLNDYRTNLASTASLV
jgi:adenylosuccinate synthase